MNTIGLHAVGLLGPGLDDFETARAILAGTAPLAGDAINIPPVRLLPANERRRTTTTIRLALKVAEEATTDSDRSQLRSVFASSSGDMDIIDRICDALTQPEPVVSPVQFHNSVHNAPAGNWSIATRNPAPATAVSGYNATVAAGLLEAATLQQCEGGEVLLTCYDVPSMETFIRVRPIHHAFAVALRLGPVEGATWRLQMDLKGPATADRCGADELEALRASNPVARALPLLEQLARGTAGHVTLDAPLGRSLSIRIEP